MKTYEAPKMDIFELSVEDVIATSNNNDEGSVGDEEDG